MHRLSDENVFRPFSASKTEVPQRVCRRRFLRHFSRYLEDTTVDSLLRGEKDLRQVRQRSPRRFNDAQLDEEQEAFIFQTVFTPEFLCLYYSLGGRPLLTLSEVAAFLGVSWRTVRLEIVSRRLPSRFYAHAHYVSLWQLMNYLGEAGALAQRVLEEKDNDDEDFFLKSSWLEETLRKDEGRNLVENKKKDKKKIQNKQR